MIALFHPALREKLLGLTAEQALLAGIDSSTEVYLMAYLVGPLERLELPAFAGGAS